MVYHTISHTTAVSHATTACHRLPRGAESAAPPGRSYSAFEYAWADGDALRGTLVDPEAEHRARLAIGTPRNCSSGPRNIYCCKFR